MAWLLEAFMTLLAFHFEFGEGVAAAQTLGIAEDNHDFMEHLQNTINMNVGAAGSTQVLAQPPATRYAQLLISFGNR